MGSPPLARTVALVNPPGPPAGGGAAPVVPPRALTVEVPGAPVPTLGWRPDGRDLAPVAALVIEVPGAPVPKARPRLGRGRVYTPPRTRAYQARVAVSALVAAPNAGIVLPLTGPLRVSFAFVLAQPRNAGEYPTRPPDLDNLVKGALDGCSCLWRDDAQVVRIVADKLYGEEPRTIIRVEGYP